MNFRSKLLQVFKESYEKKSPAHIYNSIKIFFSFFKLHSLKSAIKEQNLNSRPHRLKR